MLKIVNMSEIRTEQKYQEKISKGLIPTEGQQYKFKRPNREIFIGTFKYGKMGFYYVEDENQNLIKVSRWFEHIQ